MERIIELQIAQKNERWMKARGGVEVGGNHYKYFIFLHMLFFISLVIEIQLTSVRWNIFFFMLFFMAQVGRVWCIASLGRFWNTKVIVLPNVICIKKGPYKYFKHPNYMIVFVELFAIPLATGAYRTAVLFPMLHLFLVMIRVPIEEKALGRKV